MKLETGIDLVEVSRIQKSIQNPRFVQRVYSPEEQAFLAEHHWNAQTAAANFAAKEAFSKAIGTGVRGFALNEVSLLRDELGKPYFLFAGAASSLVKQNSLTLSVSVTHTRQYASAVVICLGGDEA